MRIGDRVEKNIHLLQVWMIRPMGGEEVLGLYPQDGYWRVRPLAPASLAPTAFGSSFLLGPVEVEGRPGKGSTFSVFIPLAVQPEADQPLIREPSPEWEEAAGGPMVWRLRGEIDTANATRIEAELLEAVARG